MRKPFDITSSWIDTVDAIYRQLAHHLRGKPPQDEGEAAFDYRGDS